MRALLHRWFWGDGWHIKTYALATANALLCMVVVCLVLVVLGCEPAAAFVIAAVMGAVQYGEVLGRRHCAREGHIDA